MMEVKAKEKSLIGEDYSCRRGENKRCCANCKTTRTPLWRAGPAGPKSLCNACGIKYRKKRREEKKVELSEVPDKINGRVTTDAITSTTTGTVPISAKNVDGSTGNGLSRSLKLKLMVYGGKLILKRSSSVVKKQRCQRRRKLGEEEEAAFSLMALSCGSVFA